MNVSLVKDNLNERKKQSEKLIAHLLHFASTMSSSKTPESKVNMFIFLRNLHIPNSIIESQFQPPTSSKVASFKQLCILQTKLLPRTNSPMQCPFSYLL